MARLLRSASFLKRSLLSPEVTLSTQYPYTILLDPFCLFSASVTYTLFGHSEMPENFKESNVWVIVI